MPQRPFQNPDNKKAFTPKCSISRLVERTRFSSNKSSTFPKWPWESMSIHLPNPKNLVLNKGTIQMKHGERWQNEWRNIIASIKLGSTIPSQQITRVSVIWALQQIHVKFSNARVSQVVGNTEIFAMKTNKFYRVASVSVTGVICFTTRTPLSCWKKAQMINCLCVCMCRKLIEIMSQVNHRILCHESGGRHFLGCLNFLGGSKVSPNPMPFYLHICWERNSFQAEIPDTPWKSQIKIQIDL